MAAITSGEILFKYSVVAATGHSVGSAAATSLGDQISTSVWAGGVANDLFDDISGAENAASTVDYRCVFIHNSNASNALQNAKVYVSGFVAGGADVTIAVDNIAASVITSGSTQAATIANETTAPTGVGAFSAPSSAGTGLDLGNIPAGSCRAIWIKRAATNSVALSGDGVTIAVSGDTGSL